MTDKQTITWQSELIEHLEAKIDHLRSLLAESLADNLILQQRLETLINTQTKYDRTDN